MIGKLLIITASLLLLLAGVAEAHHILVVQSSRVKPYEEAFRGFSRACRHEAIRIVVSELKENAIHEFIREEQPRLIVAIGADALEQVKLVRNIPILFLMVLNPTKLVLEAKNVTGILMLPSPVQQIDLIRKALPSVAKIGVLYDPVNLAKYVRQAADAARPLGLELVAREVRAPREVPGALLRLRGEIDALWMLPDPSVVSPETMEFFVLFCGENRIPLVTFSRKYVDMGALLALDVDPYDMGMQAGEMATRLIQGTDIRSIPRADARKTLKWVNTSVARRLGLPKDLAERLNAVVRGGP
jgi:putative ABC transport system substrate-binding protein